MDMVNLVIGIPVTLAGAAALVWNIKRLLTKLKGRTMNINVNTVKINYKLPHSSGVDYVATDLTPEFLAERWVKRAHEKDPTLGWEIIRGHMMAEVRTASREFWAIFRYDMKG